MVNQSMSDIHDSDNCHLGPNDLPCDMCVAAAEHEHKQRQQALKTLAEAGVFSGGDPSTLTDTDRAALLEGVLQRARDDLNDGQPLTEMRQSVDPAVAQRILIAIERDKQFASFTVIRAAGFDLIDDYCQSDVWWTLNSRNEEEANEARERFMDDFCARITALQAPPHDMDAGLRK